MELNEGIDRTRMTLIEQISTDNAVDRNILLIRTGLFIDAWFLSDSSKNIHKIPRSANYKPQSHLYLRTYN